MPAVLREGGRTNAKPRGKAPQSGASRPAQSRANRSPQGRSSPPVGGKLRAAQGVGVSPRLAATVACCVLAAGLLITLATGHRSEQLAGLAREGVASEFAGFGFRVKSVHVQGANPMSQRDILAAAAIAPGEPTLGVDLGLLRERVQRVGWVKSARVIRLLPDTIVIAVDERPPAAVWQHAGRTRVIDGFGQPIVEADPGLFNNLPLIVGAGADIAAPSILPAIAQRPRLAERVEALVRVDNRRWDLRLKDGGLVQLPAVGEDAALIQLDQLDGRQRILDLGFERIDLRDPALVAVRPRQAQATHATAPISDGV
ncbi:MAG: cell division protein FtsQ/DivIB [Caulobacterales bacterium]|nr:cell division protein FtsQ/DivIB [Caulobacterales bacterium]